MKLKLKKNSKLNNRTFTNSNFANLKLIKVDSKKKRNSCQNSWISKLKNRTFTNSNFENFKLIKVESQKKTKFITSKFMNFEIKKSQLRKSTVGHYKNRKSEICKVESQQFEIHKVKIQNFLNSLLLHTSRSQIFPSCLLNVSCACFSTDAYGFVFNSNCWSCSTVDSFNRFPGLSVPVRIFSCCAGSNR